MNTVSMQLISFGLLFAIQSFALQGMQNSDIKLGMDNTQISSYIHKIGEDFTTRNEADNLPPLTQIIAEHNAHPGDHTYIALFILYCLAHTEQELEPLQTDLEFLAHGKTLFQIAQQIKRFQSGLNDDPELLCLFNIFNIGNVLENLLDILQGLTSKTITKLDLGYNKLTILPDSIRNFTQLKALDLTDNMLKDLPDSFCELTRLEYLNLESNLLKELPDSFCELKLLKVLNIMGNLLKELPDSFCELKLLKRLYLGSNKLTILPDSFCDLTRLEYLDLGVNLLKELPDRIGNLTQLITLILSINPLTKLPGSTGDLKKLKELYLVCIEELQPIPLALNREGLQIWTDETSSDPNIVVFETWEL